MTQNQELTYRPNNDTSSINRFIQRISRHWLLLFNLTFAIFIGLPWLAPVFMKLGWENLARLIYLIYNPLCHQFPQRSYFLFGEKTMYTIDEVAEVWPTTANPFELRQFIGNPTMGWKIAWSDRMLSMYGGIFIGSVAFASIRNRVRPPSLWWLLIVSIPMGVDGFTHMASDLFGLKNGFRYHNLWLARLTNFAFDLEFYVGNAIGSFNWWMRLLSGLIFGIGIIWVLFPLFSPSKTKPQHP